MDMDSLSRKEVLIMKALVSICVLVCLFGVPFSERMFSQSTTSATKVDKKQPSVYISFDRFETVTSQDKRTGKVRSADLVWLRLHNNLSSDISVCTYDGDFTLTKKPGINYRIESLWDISGTKPIPPTILYTFPAIDFCREGVIRSGESMPFSVRRDVLVDWSRIRINFQYAWEDSLDVFYGREPEHIVFMESQKILTRKDAPKPAPRSD